MSITCGSSYPVYCSFTSPNKPGYLPLTPFCRCIFLSRQIWHQLWRQSRFPINLGWGCELVSPIQAPPCVPLHMIYCGPGEWGVRHLFTYKSRNIKKGRGSCHALHYEVLWWGICGYKCVRGVQKRTEISHHIFKRLGGVTSQYAHTKKRNIVSASTVTVTAVPHMVIQEPMWLTRMMRNHSGALMFLTRSTSLASLASYRIFVCHAFTLWAS